ncbi:TetR/AcrR family transcriptional regulator [Streptomyces palmae]|uniref:TetR/AcrR family transcriptional regulator n=1 Tax=Streptomyces palmae TaxID=1701085 RepID=A0A4Z0FW36_9ACTN|nr:TetR/AcrR family transcriptional regulator [Streptomyces palmae]TGA86047.1 TetR/AcrR family transcriptional regulator [Streptomyces palmae]
MGLREIKKQQTRTAIADAALGLFLEHGFDQVTVAEVARHAGVSTNTVFNYFPTKEDLFFDRQAEVENHLAALVRDRAPGTCPVAAVRDDLLSALRQDHPMLGLQPGAPAFWRTIRDSPALRAREREIGERVEAALATALAEHPLSATPGDTDDPLPLLVAGAIAGTHRAALRELQRRIMSGEPPAPARDTVARVAVQAFDLLCSGLHAGGDRTQMSHEPAVPQ